MDVVLYFSLLTLALVQNLPGVRKGAGRKAEIW